MSSSRRIRENAAALYEEIVNPDLLVRRMYLTAGRVIDEQQAAKEQLQEQQYQQLDLFTDYAAEEKRRKDQQLEQQREHRLQEAVLQIKGKYGKNAIIKGMNLEEGATGIQRNQQIGGHKA